MKIASTTPVILGSDLSIYTWARAFHEAYGWKSVVVASGPRGPILDSDILQPEYVGEASDSNLVAHLVSLAKVRPDQRLILIANSDHHLDVILANFDLLSQHYVIPLSSPETLAPLRDKDGFTQLCDAIGVATPKTIVIDTPAWNEQAPADLATISELTFPVIVKPAHSGSYAKLSFPGQLKVYLAETEAALTTILRRIAASGYSDQMLVQQFIPGDESANINVTLYRNLRGEITLLGASRMLLGLHSPALLGVAAGMLPSEFPELEAACAKIAALAGLRGFMNVDIKIDPRDHKPYFLDCNTRVGRSHHQLLVSGMNPAVAVSEDYLVGEQSPDMPRTQRPTQQGIFALVPFWWLRRYLIEPGLKAKVATARRGQKVHHHPLAYRRDRNLKRWFYRKVAELNLVRGLWRTYPRPTQTGFDSVSHQR